MAEWSNAAVSKTVIHANGSGVRIPPCPFFQVGQVSEWFKEHDWNSCGCYSLVGSNPTLSAIEVFRNFTLLVALSGEPAVP